MRWKKYSTAAPWLTDEEQVKFWLQTRLRGECLEWVGHRTQEGYGRFSSKGLVAFGRNHTAHHIAYELLVGPIPEGLVVDHLCRNRACVSVHHLRATSNKENTLSGNSPFAKNSRKTHCKWGHPLTEANVYHWRGLGRHCRTCQRRRMRAYYQRHHQWILQRLRQARRLQREVSV